jgi:hypothetical protein
MLRAGLLLLLGAIVMGWAGDTAAESLRGQLDAAVLQGVTLSTDENHVAHFSNESLTEVGSQIEVLAASAADVPAIATAPGFTFQYDPELKVVTRTRSALGTLFVDRADTVGKGTFEVGAAYVYLDFVDLDGDSLEGSEFTLDHAQDTGEEFENDKAKLIFDEFVLQSHVIPFFLTYGITDRWDVNVVVPLMHTRLKTDARFVIQEPRAVGAGGEPVHEFDDGSRTKRVRVSDSKTGVGDLLLRTKYRLSDDLGGFKAATVFALRIPTGEEEDFQGTGDVILSPGVIASRSFGRFDAHANLGFDIDASDVDGSRVRYGLGVSFGIIEGLGIFAELFGSSGLTDRELDFDRQQRDPDTGAVQGTVTETVSVRTDVVDVSAGFKFSVFDRLVGYAGAIVPVTDDGLRTDVVPVGGFELTF